MTTLEQAARQALWALERGETALRWKAIDALHAALNSPNHVAEQYAKLSQHCTMLEDKLAQLEARNEPVPERIRLEDGEWPIIELGYGKIEVAEGWQGETPALIFGRNGSGVIGEPTESNRAHLPGETLAVVTFANVECLEVVAKTIAKIRSDRFTAPVEQQSYGGFSLQPIAWMDQDNDIIHKDEKDKQFAYTKLYTIPLYTK